MKTNAKKSLDKGLKSTTPKAGSKTGTGKVSSSTASKRSMDDEELEDDDSTESSRSRSTDKKSSKR